MKLSPCRQNQMFDLPPSGRDNPPWKQSKELVAQVIKQGEMLQEAGAQEMCTYVPPYMGVYVKRGRKNL